jgi:hypothetical protein
MGEKLMLVLAAEFKALRLRCAHCGGARVFPAAPNGVLTDVQCDCGMPMRDANHLVASFRQFHADLQRFGKDRDATFEISWRES